MQSLSLTSTIALWARSVSLPCRSASLLILEAHRFVLSSQFRDLSNRVSLIRSLKCRTFHAIAAVVAVVLVVVETHFRLADWQHRCRFSWSGVNWWKKAEARLLYSPLVSTWNSPRGNQSWETTPWSIIEFSIWLPFPFADIPLLLISAERLHMMMMKKEEEEAISFGYNGPSMVLQLQRDVDGRNAHGKSLISELLTSSWVEVGPLNSLLTCSKQCAA